MGNTCERKLAQKVLSLINYKIISMITKEKLQQHISNFPDQISIDELIEKLIFIDKLESRIESSNRDETISEEELDNEMKQWFK